MKKKHFHVSVIALFVVSLFLVGCASVPEKTISNTNAPSNKTTQVLIDTAAVSVRLAVTDAEKTKGLAGVSELSDSEGMLFLFNERKTVSFWMKGMLIPIDIVWIDGDRIAGVAENARVLPPGTPDSSLPRYTSPQPVDTVLELSAGFFKRHNMSVGDTVIYR